MRRIFLISLLTATAVAFINTAYANVYATVILYNKSGRTLTFLPGDGAQWLSGISPNYPLPNDQRVTVKVTNSGTECGNNNINNPSSFLSVRSKPFAYIHPYALLSIGLNCQDTLHNNRAYEAAVNGLLDRCIAYDTVATMNSLIVTFKPGNKTCDLPGQSN